MADVELSSEYVAYAISYLAAKSSTGKINFIGHSQGAGESRPYVHMRINGAGG